jgi:hypothetical protein
MVSNVIITKNSYKKSIGILDSPTGVPLIRSFYISIGILISIPSYKKSFKDYHLKSHEHNYMYFQIVRELRLHDIYSTSDMQNK